MDAIDTTAHTHPTITERTAVKSNQSLEAKMKLNELLLPPPSPSQLTDKFFRKEKSAYEGENQEKKFFVS